MRTEQWEECSPDSQRAVDVMATKLRQMKATVELVALPSSLVGLADEHRVVMAYEASRSLAFEHVDHRSSLSEALCLLLDEGRAVDPLAYDALRDRIAAAKRRIADCFTEYDAILTPVVVGEAPPGLASTGDPRFGRLWTMLGLPSMAVPATVGETGLPVGVQLIGAPGADGALLALTSWLTAHDR
jgi:Asp-tRNA(Asn)/Glu-tRNA(Gln) amidotransferase A subunit family amidase